MRTEQDQILWFQFGALLSKAKMPTLENNSIRIKDPQVLFKDGSISEKDLKHYKKLVDSGEQEQAIDEYIEKYVTPYIEEYQTTIQNYISQAESGQLKRQDSHNLEKSVILLTLAFVSLNTKNFESFVSESLSEKIFIDNMIKSASLKKMILDQTLSQFNQLTQNTMLETQSNVLNHIRTLQREMIVENQKISSLDIIGSKLSEEIELFKKSLRKKYPDIYMAMEEGKILKSSIMADGTSRNFKLKNYTEMSVRTTLLNVDRTAVEVDAKVSNDEVVEFYLRDHRTVKDAREICMYLLGDKVNGKSLLALTEEAASTYGIMTIAEARGQGAFGSYCRHSIKRVSNQFMKSLKGEYA